jgi:hypothetical protein
MRQILHDLDPTCYPVTHNDTILLLKDFFRNIISETLEKGTLEKRHRGMTNCYYYEYSLLLSLNVINNFPDAEHERFVSTKNMIKVSRDNFFFD